MDDVDITTERMKREMDRLLTIRRAAGPVPTGVCLHCGEPLRDPLRWCGVDCRDRWEIAHAHRRP